MKEANMRFGDYIRKKRLEDSRELTMQNIADHLGISLSYMSAIENHRKPPFDGQKLEQLAKYLNLSDNEAALMFDLACKESRGVPYDIEDVFLNTKIGEMARYALRLSKAGLLKKSDWKALIRKAKAKKKKQNRSNGKNA